MELAKNGTHRRCAIKALGEIGDPVAAPTLFEIVKNERTDLNFSSGMLVPEAYVVALGALVSLKATGAEDELLANVVHCDIVKMLERMGDARGIPVLRQIVSSDKAKQIQGSNAESDR